MQADESIATIDPKAIGERLALARRARGLTQQQVAELLGVARTTVTAIEGGIRSPRPEELVRLARFYDRSVGDLLRATEQSQGVNFGVFFRAAGALSDPEDEAPLASDIQQFEQFCRWYVDLEVKFGDPLPQRYPPIYDSGGGAFEHIAEDIALSERNRLGLGDGPIGDLYGLLETDVGLRIFALSMESSKIAGMFLFREELGGCIAVNRKHPEVRRRWSLTHEYAHFLTDRERADISVLYSGKRMPREERLADAFAKHFLMPGAGLGRRFEAIRREKEATPADVLVLSHLYRVSFEAMILRLEEIGRLPKGAWKILQQKGFRVDKAKRFVPLSPHDPDPDLPHRYELLAARAYQMEGEESLSGGQLARVLGRDRTAALMRVEELTSEARLDDGEWQQMNLDLNASLLATAD